MLFIANKGRVFGCYRETALSFVRSKWTPCRRCSKIEPSEKGCCRNLTEKVPVIYFVSGQGRGGQHIYILIVECVRKDWTVGCKLKERVFISFSNLNLLLLQVLHSTTILDTSFFPRLISTETEDPILKTTSNDRKKRRYINISVSKLKSNTNVSEEENWPNIPIPILPCYPFWPVILARPAVPNSNLLIWTPRGFLRSEMKYLLFSQNSWNSSPRAFPEPKTSKAVQN